MVAATQDTTPIAGESRLRPLDGLRFLRHRTMSRMLRGKVSRSRWQLATAAFTSVIMWLILFGLFFEGFQVMERYRLVSGYLNELLFGLFFSALLIMLVFSTGMILYAGLFDSDEANFLLVHPIPADFVFAYKFQEAMFFSSWGFVLLGTPMVVAYGIIVGAPTSFYVLGVVYFAAFTLLPGSIGALICLLVTLVIPRRKIEFLVTVAVVALFVAAVFGIRAWQSFGTGMVSQSKLVQFLQQFDLSNIPLMPSHWMSKGLLTASYPDGFSRSLSYLLVLLSNALFAFLLTAAVYKFEYRRAYNRVHSYNFLKKPSERSWLPKIVDCVFRFLPVSMRILILKDVRTFSRDPLQFLQLLIFTGLVGFYITAIGRQSFYADSPYWRNMISFLNLAVMALFVTIFTSRFVFPLLSLEGQKLWILGLCPIKRDTILWGKFAFSAAGATLLTTLLALLAVIMVTPSPTLIALQFVMIPILCCGVSGIAVGLGARFVDLKQTDPSRIASSLPGTLNLVVCLLFILMVIAAVAVPWHFASAQAIPQLVRAAPLDAISRAMNPDPSNADSLAFVPFGIAFDIVVGAIATLLPMRIGIRSFRRMEI